jgi:hypothetical protein
MMNDPFVVEQAQHWSAQLTLDGVSPSEIVTGMYLRAFSRPPETGELEQAVAFVETQAEELSAVNQESERRAWADLAHVLMNVKEFIYLK